MSERSRAGRAAPRVAAIAVALALGLACASAAAADPPFAERPAVQAFLAELAGTQGLDRTSLDARFEALSTDERVLELIARPAEKRLVWREYRSIFLTEERIQAGRDFLAEHAVALRAAEAEHGVPREVVAAIIGVETFFGRITGRFNVLRALATLGFDYPPRADFFRGELAEYLVLAGAEGWDTAERQGSYAGAMGWPQFIPSSYRAYAVDGDGDGRRDLFDSVPDAVSSVGNYLARHGWRPGEVMAERWTGAPGAAQSLLRDGLKPEIDPRDVRRKGFRSAAIDAAIERAEPVSVMRFEGEAGEEWVVGYNNFYAITRYNHSRLYARAVVQLAFALD